nr:translation initiation factor IF-2-like [Taeniopygia guttata]
MAPPPSRAGSGRGGALAQVRGTAERLRGAGPRLFKCRESPRQPFAHAKRAADGRVDRRGIEKKKYKRKETQKKSNGKRDKGARPAATSRSERRAANGSARASPRLKSPRPRPAQARWGPAHLCAHLCWPRPPPVNGGGSAPASRSAGDARPGLRRERRSEIGSGLLPALRGVRRAQVGPGLGSGPGDLGPGPAGVCCRSRAEPLLPRRAGWECRGRRIGAGSGLGSGPVSPRAGGAAPPGPPLPLRLRPVRGWRSPEPPKGREHLRSLARQGRSCRALPVARSVPNARPGTGTGAPDSAGTDTAEGLPVAPRPGAAPHRHAGMLQPGQAPPTAQRDPRERLASPGNGGTAVCRGALTAIPVSDLPELPHSCQ